MADFGADQSSSLSAMYSGVLSGLLAAFFIALCFDIMEDVGANAHVVERDRAAEMAAVVDRESFMIVCCILDV